VFPPPEACVGGSTQGAGEQVKAGAPGLDGLLDWPSAVVTQKKMTDAMDAFREMRDPDAGGRGLIRPSGFSLLPHPIGRLTLGPVLILETLSSDLSFTGSVAAWGQPGP